MRLTILKDHKISLDEIRELEMRFCEIYRTTTKIEPTFFVEEHDYSHIPLVADPDGDLKPTRAYFEKWTGNVHKRYGSHGTDHVVFLVHEDNWVFHNVDPKKRGIWGQNWSNIYHGYQVQLCRFDKDKMVNSLGTLYHEVHHSHDAFIAAMLGINVDLMMGLDSWDREITHGQGAGWEYIRRGDENFGSLRFIAPYLRQAYQKRREIYARDLKSYEQIIALLARAIVFIRAEMNRKAGVQ